MKSREKVSNIIFFFVYQQKSQEEVSRLQRELSERVSEHRVTQESLEDALRALDSVNREETASKNVPTPGAEDRKYARENHFLKTEVRSRSISKVQKYY